ncbi:antibiotic acetyltransferase [Rhodobacterales bacterium HKCCSP123]|nr:antibiotic acetyltransferase [Rhodobacterales bacterium HKCCSP123]
MKLVQSVLGSLRTRLDRVNVIASGARIASGAWVSGSEISSGSQIGSGCKIYRAILSGHVEVARYTSLWGPSILVSGGAHGVHIGSFCSIAHHVFLQEQFHNAQRTTTYFIERNFLAQPEPPEALISKGPIRIGHDVWIGAGAQVLSGVTVGDGAVVGAGAIVTRDVAPYAVVAGNPARIIRYRFEADRIARLLDLQWWNWSEDRLRSESAFLTEVVNRPD